MKTEQIEKRYTVVEDGDSLFFKNLADLHADQMDACIDAIDQGSAFKNREYWVLDTRTNIVREYACTSKTYSRLSGQYVKGDGL